MSVLFALAQHNRLEMIIFVVGRANGNFLPSSGCCRADEVKHMSFRYTHTHTQRKKRKTVCDACVFHSSGLYIFVSAVDRTCFHSKPGKSHNSSAFEGGCRGRRERIVTYEQKRRHSIFSAAHTAEECSLISQTNETHDAPDSLCWELSIRVLH